MSDNLNRLRQHLRDIELQAETQMQSRLAQAKELQAGFDPLEFDRYTRLQELTRMLAESVNDVATVQRSLQRTVEGTVRPESAVWCTVRQLAPAPGRGAPQPETSPAALTTSLCR